MKKTLYFIPVFLLLLFSFAYAVTDTFEGETVTNANSIEGTTACDTVEGQALKSSTTTDYSQDANCMGAWYMNGGASANGDDETDRSGEGQTLTETSGDIPNSASVPSGYSGTSRDFEFGESEYLAGSTSGSLDITGHTGLTVAAWVKVENDTGPAHIVSKWDNVATYRQYALRIIIDNNFEFAVSNDGSTTVKVTATTKFSTGTYQHVVGVHDPDNDELRIYVDGSSDATPQAHSTGIYAGNAAFSIGVENAQLYYDGLMDEVIVFNRVLSPAEILEIYNNGISGNKGGND